MALSLTIFADGPSADLAAYLGAHSEALYARLLADTVAVAMQLPGALVQVRHHRDAPRALLAALPRQALLVPTAASGGAAVRAALADGLAAGGPALVIGGDLPHLPLWRLRDAATHLEDEADLVLGPNDRGSWYLIGMRDAAGGLLEAVPGRGASTVPLAGAARMGHVVHLLPPWFGVDTVGDLAALAEAMRSMPVGVAEQTRTLLEVGQASRAVGG